jgi:GntR family transcriptional regulator, transcriptional repressor for pyruvate dehydrogenase complex
MDQEGSTTGSSREQRVTRSGSPSEVIARELREDIFSGRYRPGERLPSERELAARYGANRGSAREALKQLEHLRLIHVQRGGARVNPAGEASLDALEHMLDASRSPDPGLVEECVEVLEILFAGAVRLACERATDEELARAQELVGCVVAPELSDRQYLALLWEISALLSTASRNQVLPMARNWLKRVFAQRFGASRVQLLPPREPTLIPVALRIQEALAQRDGIAAEQGVRDLFRASRKLLLAALDEA